MLLELLSTPTTISKRSYSRLQYTPTPQQRSNRILLVLNLLQDVRFVRSLSEL